MLKPHDGKRITLAGPKAEGSWMRESGSVPVKGAFWAQMSVLVLVVIAGAGFLAPGASAADTAAGSLAAAGGNVYVSSVVFDPTVFFTGDTGTVTYSITNGNANQSITVNHAGFGDNNIRRTSGTFDTSASIGPLQTKDYTFSVVANAGNGIYYPTFSLSYFGSMSLWHQANVQVDNTPLVLLVTDTPDTFSLGTKDTVSVQIANPRKNDVKNVILQVSGDGLSLMPEKIFIGDLAPGKSTTVNFTATPDRETTMNLTVRYNNGDNVHTVATTLPVTLGSDKKKATPVISNVEVTNIGGVYHVTGDITNAGLLTANAVTVTSLAPAVPADPYRSYIIGALKQDDFGSFELTFTTDNTTSVPIQLSYKDKDGNVITSQQSVSLGGVTSTVKSTGGPDILPILALVIIIAVSGGYYYLRMRKTH